jgi:hypothetical protein
MYWHATVSIDYQFRIFLALRRGDGEEEKRVKRAIHCPLPPPL